MTDPFCVSLRSGALAAAATACLVVAPAGAVEIGSVAAANRDVLGTPPAEDTRQLLLGARVVLEERIQTSDLGAGQFMFLDQTALTVWPNSDVVLDEYVYDPNRGTGRAAISATRGMLRFIGGRISKTDDVTIRTPHSVVAVRGGIAQIVVTDLMTRVVHIAGEYTKVGNLVLARPMAIAEVSTADPEPRFVGIGDAVAVGELYGASVGQGAGGLDAPPEESAVNTALGASGLPPIGSGDGRALVERPVSTRGEREPLTEEAQVRLIVDQTAEAAVDTQEPEVDLPPLPPPMPPVLDITTPSFTPVDVPVGTPPPIPVLPVGPVSGVTGALFRAQDADGGNRVFSSAGTSERFVSAERFQEAGAYPYVTALTSTSGLNFAEIPGFFQFAGAGAIGGRPADVVNLVDPGVFSLSAFRTAGALPDDLALGFIGIPAPTAAPAYFAASNGADLTVPTFQLSADLFSIAFNPFPPQLGVPDGAFAPLYIVPEPNAPLLPAYSAGLAADPSATASKWMLGWFEVVGAGASQTSALGGLTALVLPTEAGHPSLSGDLLFVGQTASTAPVGLGRLVLGSLGDLAGVTSFGALGQYAVLGGGGPYLANTDPGIDLVESSYVVFTEAGARTFAYSSTRATELVSQPVVPASIRNTLGANLTAGFASGQGVSFRPNAASGSRVSAPYLLGTTVPTDVRVAFTPANNGVAVEMSGLRGVAGTGSDISGLQLNWGGGDGRDAMLTDGFFVVRETAGTTGPITGQPVQIAGDTGRSPETRHGRDYQTAFVGTVVAHDVVGDGGLLPSGVDPSPEYLRWGWWAGEYRHAETDATITDAGRVERTGVGAWVAGIQSDIASVNAATGTGTYQGLAVGNVIETVAGAPVSYLQGGRFEMTYNFGIRQGTASLTGIADQTLASTVSGAAAAGGNHYAGDLTGFAGPGSGSIRGVFFQNGADPTAATGGAFDFNAVTAGGNPAAVSGVFGADRTGPLAP